MPPTAEREAARRREIERHVPLVRALARGYARGAEPYDDLVQAGCLGLIAAVDRWDAARGSSFEAYAVPTIHGAIRHHLRDRAPGGRAPRTGAAPVLTPLEDDLPGREDPIAAADDRLALALALRRLPVRERRIVALAFYGDRSSRAIARDLGLSQVHVSRLLRSALARLEVCLAEPRHEVVGAEEAA
jgi:RNA polymerase sigma-B factor